MTVKNSLYSQVQPLTFGTALTASGTPVASPGTAARLRFDHFSYWLVDPAGSNTVTLALGTVTLPPVGLSSSRSSFTHGPFVLDINSAVVATLSGSGSVGFYGQYVIATTD
jgi:hypothetical protein